MKYDFKLREDCALPSADPHFPLFPLAEHEQCANLHAFPCQGKAKEGWYVWPAKDWLCIRAAGQVDCRPYRCSGNAYMDLTMTPLQETDNSSSKKSLRHSVKWQKWHITVMQTVLNLNVFDFFFFTAKGKDIDCANWWSLFMGRIMSLLIDWSLQSQACQASHIYI